jgi:hypothetical protein
MRYVRTGIVEIDTTGGPGFGFEHFKQYDFLATKQYDFLRDQGIRSDFRRRTLAGSAESSE